MSVYKLIAIISDLFEGIGGVETAKRTAYETVTKKELLICGYKFVKNIQIHKICTNMTVNECSAKSLCFIRERQKAITEEESNFLRTIILMLRVAPQAVREKFDTEFPPVGLQIVLNQNRVKFLEPLKKKRIINQKQWDLLFPRTGIASSNGFDLTLMICLIRNLTEISVGDLLPLPSVANDGADLSRMKHYRNMVAHCKDGTLSNLEFQKMWTEISQAIVRLGGINFQQKCDDLKDYSLDKNDMEIVNEFRNTERSNNPISKGCQEVLDNIIKGWKILDEKVVETSAIKHLQKLATTANIITVIGSPGCGKSTAVYHLALQLHRHQDYDIIYSHDPMDLRNYFNPDRKQIFVFDDVYGKYMLEHPKRENWSRLSNEINIILQNKTVKIFSSCRTLVYNQIEKDGDIICRTICNLLSDEHILTVDERVLMAGKYLPEDMVSSLSLTENFNKYDFFPLLCKLSSNKTSADIEKLYSHPVDFIRQDLLSMMKLSDQTTVATLFLFVIYNNCLTKELFCRKSEIRNVLQDLSEEFKIPYVFSIKIVKKQLEFLKQSYVIETEKKYKVIHDKIFDIMISFFGQYLFDLVLQYAHSDVVRDRFQTESTGAPRNETMIFVSAEKEGDYLERLCTDIKNGDVENVFLNHQLQYQSFRKKLISWFEMNTTELAGSISMHSNKESSPLLTMTFKGYSDMIHMLINMNLNINVCDEYGRTPLIISSWKGNIDIVKILLMYKCNPDCCSKYDMSALYVASWMGFSHIVKLLLESKCNVNIKEHKNWNPLYIASDLGYNSTVELLLQHKCINNLSTFDHKSPLYIALLKGHFEIAKMILRPICCSDTCDKYTKSTLSMVLHKFHVMIFNSIVEVFNYKKSFPIENYFRSGNIKVDVVSLLLLHKWNVNSCDDILREYKLSFVIAISYEYDDVVSLLLNDQINAGYFCQDENSPLILCLENENILKMLLEKDFHYSCKSHDQFLCMAALKGLEKTAKLLLQYNCNPNGCNRFGESPLYLASKNDNVEIVKLFLQNGADPNIGNKYNHSPLHIAAQYDRIETATLLLAYYCDIDVCNNRNETPLHIATSYGSKNVVELLLSKGCNPGLFNNNNESPLYIATTKGDVEIVKLLLKNKCDPDVQLAKDISKNALKFREYHGPYRVDPDLQGEMSKILFAENPKEMSVRGNSPEFVPIYIASKLGHTEIVRALLDHKCNPNINFDGNTALFIASAKGHEEIVRLLLDYGSNPHFCNQKYESPIYIASRYGNTEIVKLLLHHKLNHWCCEMEKAENIIKTNTLKFFTKSALYTATRMGHEDIVKLLLGYKNCQLENECPLYGMMIRGKLAMQYTEKVWISQSRNKIQDFIRLYSANNEYFPVFSDVAFNASSTSTRK
ncbi:ANK [Mytilus coruscus]|uniref:ANK n=1 Tax=Mytilus coruscus TaxID=42192 RepID=A0A6J8BIF3_MYTCO|nr:ANK [Mytilus coruscus]